MSFSFCLNKNEMLTLCGLSLLYHGLDLRQDGKLMQDGNRLVAVVINFLANAKAPGAADFKRLATSMINLDAQLKPRNGRTTDNAMAAPPSTSSLHTKSNTSPRSHQKQGHSQVHRHTSATMSESDLISQQEKLRRATLPHTVSQHPEAHYYSRTSTDSSRSETAMGNHEYCGSMPPLKAMMKPQASKHQKLPNLDYLSLSNIPTPSQSQSPTQARSSQVSRVSHGSMVTASAYSGPKTTAEPTEWEVLLASFDDRNLYDAIYGGGPDSPRTSAGAGSSNHGPWSPESWDYTSTPMGDFLNPTTSHSVLSVSDESLNSGEDLSTTELGLSAPQFDYKDPFLPGGTSLPGNAFRFLYDGLDASFAM